MFLAVINFPLPDGYDPDYVDLALYVDNHPAAPPIGFYPLANEYSQPCIRRIRTRINTFANTAFLGAEPPLPGYAWLCLASEGWKVNYADLRKGQNLMKYLACIYALLNE